MSAAIPTEEQDFDSIIDGEDSAHDEDFDLELTGEIEKLNSKFAAISLKG